MGLGRKIRARGFGAVAAMATPGSGSGPEVIWHQFYDTQTYVSAGQATLRFFQATNTDITITNMPAGGQLPDPQFLAVHDICLDFEPSATSAASGYVTQLPNATTSGQTTGVLNDLGIIMLAARPIWTFFISDKRYGPYSLSALHGTGAIVGSVFAWGVGTATVGIGYQYAYNTPMAGWNYEGSVIIPPKVNIQIQIDWSAVTAVGAIYLLRLSLFGVLTRRVV